MTNVIKTTIGELFGFDDAEVIELEEKENDVTSNKDKSDDYK